MKSTKYQLLKADYDFACKELKQRREMIETLRKERLQFIQYNENFLKLLRTQASINDVVNLINKRFEAEKYGKKFEW